MRTVGLVILLTAPIAGVMFSQPATSADVAVIGLASVRVAEVWDAGTLAPIREAILAKAPRTRERLKDTIWLDFAEIERVTFCLFKIGAGDTEWKPAPVYLIVPRKPIDVEALARSLHRTASPKASQGPWAALPEFRVLDRGTRAGVSLIASADRIICIPPMLNPLDRHALESAMVAKVVQRDADRAAQLARENTIAIASFDVAELVRTFSSVPDGHGEGGEGTGIPPALMPLTKARIASFSATLAKSLALKAELSFASEEDAVSGKAGAEAVLSQIGQWIEEYPLDPIVAANRAALKELQTFAVQLLSGAAVVQEDRRVTVNADRELTAGVVNAMAGSVGLIEESVARAQSEANLKLIVTAVHVPDNDAANNADRGLIENICDDAGKPLLSWRVQLLPRLGEEELYKQFRLNEAWDSEHNKKLIAKMPKFYALPSTKTTAEGQTYYQAFLGKKGVAVRPILQDGDPHGLSYGMISDGTYCTVLLVEAAEAVPWTKPADIPFDPEAALPKLGGHFTGGFHVLLCDGRVRFAKDTVDPIALKAAITANGGEVHMLFND